MPYITPPNKTPLFIRFATWIAERKTKKEMAIPKILAWYPKAALSSGVLEALIAHHDSQLSDRLLQLLRIRVSALVGCPFCLDMNSNECDKNGITAQELAAVQMECDIAQVATFSKKERAVIDYATALTATPVLPCQKMASELKAHCSEREFVIVCTTIAQVNYWARMIKGFGVTTACLIKQK